MVKFHDDLQEILDWSWKNRNVIMAKATEDTNRAKGETHLVVRQKPTGAYTNSNEGMRLIYKKYNEVDAKSTWSTQDTKTFVGDLISSTRNLGPPPKKLWLQVNNIRLQSVTNLTAKDAQKAGFIHFSHPNSAGVQERIYLNIRGDQLAKTFGEVVNLIWDLPGIYSAKTMVPHEKSRARADTALIYCKDTRVRDEALERIRPYHERNAGKFNMTLPKMVRHYLTGIGYASEPPRYVPLRPDAGTFDRSRRGANSFGSFRAALIFIALERTKFPKEFSAVPERFKDEEESFSEERKEVFFSRVYLLFKAAGLSVTEPDTQLPEDEIDPRWRNG